MSDMITDDIKMNTEATVKADAKNASDKNTGRNKISFVHDAETDKKVVGIIILLATIMVVADKLGLFDFSVLVQAGGWRLTFAILLALNGIDAAVHKEHARFFLSAAIVVIMYKPQLGIEDVSFWYILLVAALLSISFALIIPTGTKNSLYRFEGSDHNENNYENSNVMFSIFLGGGVKQLVTNKLRFVKLRCRLGDMSVFFTHAKPETSEVTVDVKVVAGTMTLYIPREANIVNELTMKAGNFKGFEGNAESYANDAEEFVNYRITGKVVWGTVAIERV